MKWPTIARGMNEQERSVSSSRHEKNLNPKSRERRSAGRLELEVVVPGHDTIPGHC